jgi:hypothetical protein
MGAVPSRRCEAVATLLAGLNHGRPGGKSSGVNVHVAWRMALAKRAAQAYVRNKQLAALTVAGSVGTGLADRF